MEVHIIQRVTECFGCEVVHQSGHPDACLGVASHVHVGDELDRGKWRRQASGQVVVGLVAGVQGLPVSRNIRVEEDMQQVESTHLLMGLPAQLGIAVQGVQDGDPG